MTAFVAICWAGRWRVSRAGNRLVHTGLTLLELMAVLVILAVVATVAVHSLHPRVEQVRWEQARQLLDEVRKASLGVPHALHGHGEPLVSGFFADVGRLPKWLPLGGEATGDGFALAELWDRTGPLARDFPFRLRTGPRTPVDYTNVRLPCGWRGPYLMLGVGQDALVDPWARPLEVRPGPDGSLSIIRLRPLPGVVDPTSYEVDLSPGFTTVAGVLSGTEEMGSADVTVVLLTPDPDQSLEFLAVRADEDTEPNSFLFSRVPIGLRALCIQFGGRQIVRYVTVPQGGVSLNLRVASVER